MVQRAHVLGSGVTALSVASLLARQHFAVTRERTSSNRGPVVVLNPVTVDLLAHLFDGVPTALAGAHPIRFRSVRWGVDASAVTVPAPALVVPEERLVEALSKRAPNRTDESATAPYDTWYVCARGRGSPRTSRRRFGQRRILAAEFTLCGPDAVSVLENTCSGWVFMAPTGPRRAVVQAAVPEESPHSERGLLDLVAETQDIAARIGEVLSDVTVADGSPSLAPWLVVPGAIAVGDEAVSFDPLNGDGVGQALRASILASAVLAAIAAGQEIQTCLTHYRSRLIAALARHLRGCERYYRTAAFSQAWAPQLADTAEGIADLETQLARLPPFAFGLRERSLVPLADVAPR